eukprot:113387_1
MALLTVFSIHIVLSNAISAERNSYIETPHGLRLSQCVHGAAEPDAVITTVLNSTHDGVLVSYPASGKFDFHPTLPECVEEANKLFENFTDDPYHDWQQNLYQDDTPSIGSFEGYYTLPNESPPKEGQTLFYFIGMVNYGQTDKQVTIIQPVATYSSNLCTNWCVISWNCCPNGQTLYGGIVDLPENAKNVYGFCSANSSHIFVKSEYNGKQSTLTQPLDGRVFNYVDVTFEQWRDKDCKDYTNKPFNFTNLKVKTKNGQNFSPKWKMKTNKTCHGGIKLYNEFNAAIWGADKPN